MGLLDQALASALPAFPRGLVHLVARRYIAGTTIEDALATVEALNAEGATGTIDVLGENISRTEEAARTRDTYLELLRQVSKRGLDSHVSVKLTALGLDLDVKLCRKNVAEICTEAASFGSYVRLDMEDATYTDRTLALYDDLRGEHANVGPVLQSRLRRTLDDARELAAHRANVRLCKGIYPESEEIAWTGKEEIRDGFRQALRILLEGGCHVGIATHDDVLIQHALGLVRELKLDRSAYEFQMLLGVEEGLRRMLLKDGHRLRVYIPFGDRWYEYSLRRLKENPEVAGHVARATVTRLFGG